MDSSWLKFGLGVISGIATTGVVVVLVQRYTSQRGKSKDPDVAEGDDGEDLDLGEDMPAGLATATVNDSLLQSTNLQHQHTLLMTPGGFRPSHPESTSNVVGLDRAQAAGGSSSAESQSLLNLLFNIAEDQAKRKGFVHRGVTCNACGASPICGIRYKCTTCVDYDLCERCEPLDIHNVTHLLVKIKLPLPPLSNPRSVLIKPLYTGKENTLSPLQWDDIAALKKSTFFDQFEIEALYEQYRALCQSDQGISRDVYNLCLGPLGQEKNLIIDRVFQFYDADGNGYIDFPEMVRGLSVLVKGSQQDKVQYVFRGYDLEERGSIGQAELRAMFKAYFAVTIELVRDVVRTCEEEMMASFDDAQGKPVSSLFSAPIPSDTGIGFGNAARKIPFPGNPGGREGMWSVIEAMSQDAIDEMIANLFKAANLETGDRLTLEVFEKLCSIDSSLMAWFDSLGTVF